MSCCLWAGQVLKAKEKELVIRMHQTYARIAAEKEIRDTEELKMLHEKYAIPRMPLEALFTRRLNTSCRTILDGSPWSRIN